MCCSRVNVLLEVAYALEVVREWNHCLEGRRKDLEVEIAKSTLLAHLVQVRDQAASNRVLGNGKLDLADIFSTGNHISPNHELFHALGIMTVESNSTSRCNRPFARFENRELLLLCLVSCRFKGRGACPGRCPNF